MTFRKLLNKNIKNRFLFLIGNSIIAFKKFFSAFKKIQLNNQKSKEMQIAQVVDAILSSSCKYKKFFMKIQKFFMQIQKKH